MGLGRQKHTTHRPAAPTPPPLCTHTPGGSTFPLRGRRRRSLPPLLAAISSHRDRASEGRATGCREGMSEQQEQQLSRAGRTTRRQRQLRSPCGPVATWVARQPPALPNRGRVSAGAGGRCYIVPRADDQARHDVRPSANPPKVTEWVCVPARSSSALATGSTEVYETTRSRPTRALAGAAVITGRGPRSRYGGLHSRAGMGVGCGEGRDPAQLRRCALQWGALLTIGWGPGLSTEGCTAERGGKAAGGCG